MDLHGLQFLHLLATHKKSKSWTRLMVIPKLGTRLQTATKLTSTFQIVQIQRGMIKELFRVLDIGIL